MRHAQLRFRPLIGLVLAFCIIQPALAADDPYADVLATRGGATLTGLDLAGKLGDLNEQARLAALMSNDRLALLMDSVLLTLQMAEEGKRSGLDRDPVVRRQMELAALDVLADHALRHRLDQEATTDREKALESYARERYLANRESYDIPPSVQVRHLLISNDRRSRMEQEAIAKDLHTRALAGEDFEALVMEYSDDGSKRNNTGLIDITDPGQLDSAFADAALSLRMEQPISEPVRSAFGLHIIKLEKRSPGQSRSFDDVKDSLVQRLASNFEESRKQRLLSDLRADKPTHDAEALARFQDWIANRRSELETGASGTPDQTQ